MKVLDLRCDHGHGFEGWFGSEADFLSQRERGLVECPLCGSHAVDKLPSAPRLNLSGAREPAAERPGRGARTHGAAPEGGGMAQAGGPGALPAPDAAGPRSAPGAGPGGPMGPAGGDAAIPAALQAAWVAAVQHVLKNTEDVGERFPEEARRIHYGEVPQRGIRGVATPEQRAELADEGVEVVSLPIPRALKGPLQ